MPSSCKCAFFDNDGTLMESMHYWRLGALEYMIAHRMPIPGEMTLEELFNYSSRAFTQELAQKQSGVTYDEVVFEMEQRMARHYRYDVLEKRGVGAFLARLAQRGVRMCVATAAPRELCEEALERLDLRRYFEFVQGRYDLPLHKGEPEYFLRLAERMGASPEDCWVFEDAIYAMRGAREAGMRVCAVEDYTALRHREEVLATADVYITDFRLPPRFLREDAEAAFARLLAPEA